LAAELVQFLAVIVVFVVVGVVWLCVVYLPGRTLERWEDQRPGRDEERGGPRRAG